MAQKFDIGLNAKINEFAKKFNIIRTDTNDDDVFEERLSELGITDVGSKAGLYIDRGMFQLKKWLQQSLRNLLELLFQAAALVIAATLLTACASP